MGSQTEEWKSDPYIDFGGGEFVGPLGILMNRKSASGFLHVDVLKKKQKKKKRWLMWRIHIESKKQAERRNLERHN